ncbi:MAG: VOC family protein [Rhodobacteraceae bacterium]|nr:VOC family protein [Paracoccaceae bacterium]
MAEIHGRVWWSELMTRDVPGAVEFYETVCGWTVATMDMPEGPYRVCHADGVPVAGIMDMTPLTHLDGVRSHWMTYLAVDDVDHAMTETLAAGGVVQRVPFDIPEVGRVAIVTDPGGGVVGLITPVLPAS